LSREAAAEVMAAGSWRLAAYCDGDDNFMNTGNGCALGENSNGSFSSGRSRDFLLGFSAALFLIIALVLPSGAQAAKIKGLYELKLPVVSQDREERLASIKTAFERLLVRVTGKHDVFAQAEVQEIIKNSVSFLSRFNYEKLPEDFKQPALEGKEAKRYSQQIVIVFDEDAVNRELRKNGLPVWGKVRPTTLLWIVYEDENGRQVLDENQPNQMIELIRTHAADRSMPILFPLWDLQDQIAVTSADIWGNFKDNIISSSERYAVESILVAKIYRDPIDPLWRAAWHLYVDKDELAWESEAEDAQSALEAGMSGVTDNLASRFAHVSEEFGTSDILLDVSGISSLKQYVKVAKYLGTLEPVEKMIVSTVKPKEVVFKVTLRTGVGSLEKAISLSNVLLPQEQEKIAVSSIPSLYYRLKP